MSEFSKTKGKLDFFLEQVEHEDKIFSANVTRREKKDKK